MEGLLSTGPTPSSFSITYLPGGRLPDVCCCVAAVRITGQDAAVHCGVLGSKDQGSRIKDQELLSVSRLIFHVANLFASSPRPP